MLTFEKGYNFVMLLCIYNIFALSVAKPSPNSGRLVMCDLRRESNLGNLMQCNVNKGHFLDYRDIRNWSEKAHDKKYSVRINCAGGIIYLPWPFKAKNIISLEVYRCKVLGFLSEMTVKQHIADELKTVILSDITVEIPFREMILLRDRINQVPKSTDCGQLTMEKLILKDIHYDLKMTPEERDGVQQASFAGNAGHNSVKQQDPCIYKSLKYIDESGSRKSGQYHLKLIPEHSKFPALEVYNMSGNEMGHVPNAFRHLHSGKFPALRHIDFSNNFLRTFEFDLPTDPKTCRLEIVDLRNNHINAIPSAITQRLKNIGNILVDVRHNPLKCGCRLAPFRQYLESQYHKVTDVQKRQRVAEITCINGSILHRKLNKVSILKATFDKKCQR
ncbi:uncharacterized protein LOC123549494 [Mercenaria mercenaria]|uniref:uncharacterized protein LOC123549494 n=1 Tax=Mercenaria mercenaria TaxID=6596 RepID=UPI00234E641E|nr:uncharacterized protein LOC123549494 [Mercenaria mercenaria]